MGTVRILFLDIDGVLNSWRWWEERRTVELAYPESFGPHARRRFRDIDPKAVARLNRLVDADVSFVLSSTWRLHDLDPIREGDWKSTLDHLRAHGFRGEFLGYTPVLNRTIAGTPFVSGVRRGIEIANWIDDNALGARIAIVDDDSDMAGLLPWLVQTDTAIGLEDEHVDRILDTLERPSPPRGLIADLVSERDVAVPR